ncbi:MAG: hypothetical protein AVDCRST_MAG77-1491 [uncultured Chloroflexi bacterium]|uniref:Uncharacterized protein n=1 Tax=uncultured Chloroflexota bacterium TaxID=166587 RepID=A0A6J4HYD1_9CHLR|nr:MAG: hypothetical protein AVDCRST_MAG77-1491 [uncultured Chloroflexota bacterium]
MTQRNAAATEHMARLKPLADGVYRLICGRPYECPGPLGFTRDERVWSGERSTPDPDPAHEALVQRVMARLPASRWTVWHPWGLRWDPDAMFRILRVIKPARNADHRPTGRRRGRDNRPTPEPLLRELIRENATRYVDVGGAVDEVEEVDEDRLHREALPHAERHTVFGLPERGEWAPELPTLIVCPACGHLNRVCAPQGS